MQKLFYEKEIDLFHRLKELVSLTVDESIDYKMEDNGIRAVGALVIKGEYLSDEKKNFLENVELDIYADHQKIIDPQDFHLKVEDFHYEIQEGNLKMTIEVGVYGVEEGENRYIQVDLDPLEEIETLTRDLDEKKQEETPEIKRKELSKKVYETKVKNEVEEAQEETGVYYLYVVCVNDTYESIAKAYHISEKVIRDYNNNLSLDVGQIVIIPYDPKADSNKV